MSVRESIAENIITVLEAVHSPIRIAYITRQPFEFDELSNAQYPAILLRTADEDREDSTLGGSIGTRMAIINYQLVCFVKSSLIDEARNNIIETIEEGLDVDRTRGGFALDTQITSIEIDEGSIHPIGGVILTVRVQYQYVRGTT